MSNRNSIEDQEDMINVTAQEYKIAQSNDKNYILKTLGIISGITVTLYDKKGKIGAMAHFSTKTGSQKLKEIFQFMIWGMQVAGYKDEKRSEVEVRIVGGRYGRSKKLLADIKDCLTDFKLSNLIEISFAKDTDKILNIALNTRTGKLFDLTHK